MSADRPATSKTGANRQRNVHEYFYVFQHGKVLHFRVLPHQCVVLSVPHLGRVLSN